MLNIASNQSYTGSILCHELIYNSVRIYMVSVIAISQQ